MKLQIAKVDYYALLGIYYAISVRKRDIESLTADAARILGVKSETDYGDAYYGLVTDAVYEDWTVKELLGKLKIKIKDQPTL